MCAGTVLGGKDSCDSDSGSPLLVGVTGDGIGCARPNTPSINAKASGMAGWIHNSICEISNHPPKDCFEQHSNPILCCVLLVAIALTGVPLLRGLSTRLLRRNFYNKVPSVEQELITERFLE